VAPRLEREGVTRPRDFNPTPTRRVPSAYSRSNRTTWCSALSRKSPTKLLPSNFILHRRSPARPTG